MNFRLLGKTTCLILLSTATISLNADHSWNGYKWAKQTTEFTLQVVDSTTSNWWVELDAALTEWSTSDVIDLWITEQDDTESIRQSCPMVPGKIRVCNASYGSTGWLGLGSIGIDAYGNLDRGTAKINDSYSSSWSSQSLKNHVMCHEVGHLFGLGHTSVDGSSQQSCMDYSNSVDSQWPNLHDYNQLLEIYASLSSYNSYDDALDNDGSEDPAPDPDPEPAPEPTPEPDPEPEPAPDPGTDDGSTGGKGKGGKGGKGGGGDGGGKGKGKNKFAGSDKFEGTLPEIPPKGIRVAGNKKHELWVSPRKDGGLWVHHVFLVPEADDNGHSHNDNGKSKHKH